MNKYDWDLESLLKGSTIENLFTEYVNQLKKIIKLYPTFVKNLKTFKNWINENEKATVIGNRLSNYISCKHTENIVDPVWLQWMQKANLTLTKLSEPLADIENRIIDNENKIRQYLKDKDLSIYQRGYELIFKNKNHILKPEIEKVIHKLSVAEGGVFSAFNTLTDSDLKFDDVIDSKNKKHPFKNSSQITEFLKSPDRIMRKNAWINFHSAYNKYANTLTQTLYYSYLKFNTDAKLYNFKDYIDASTYDDEINEQYVLDIYKNVEQFKSVYQKYSNVVKNILKKQLKLNKLEPWDMGVDLTKNDIKITPEEAKNMVLEGLKPLGEEYQSLLNKAFNENWISWMPKENKESGAYSIGGTKGLDKFFILMNFNNTIDSAETLAHELGHSINSYYANKTQKAYPEVSIFWAEIASICNETLMMLYFIDKYKDNKQQVNVFLQHLFTNFFNCTTRQIIFSNFEYIANQKVNNAEMFDAQTLKTLYLDLIKKYEGMKNNAYSKYKKVPYSYSLSTILRIPHFYAGNFYVYKYAIGQICGLIMAYKIYKQDQNTLKFYFNFLKSGSSLSPVDTIKLLGIDLTQKQTYDEVNSILNELLKKFSS